MRVWLIHCWGRLFWSEVSRKLFICTYNIHWCHWPWSLDWNRQLDSTSSALFQHWLFILELEDVALDGWEVTPVTHIGPWFMSLVQVRLIQVYPNSSLGALRVLLLRCLVVSGVLVPHIVILFASTRLKASCNFPNSWHEIICSERSCHPRAYAGWSSWCWCHWSWAHTHSSCIRFLLLCIARRFIHCSIHGSVSFKLVKFETRCDAGTLWLPAAQLTSTLVLFISRELVCLLAHCLCFHI